MPTIKCYDKFGIEIENLTQQDMNIILIIHDFQIARNNLNTEIENAVNTLITGIRDASPTGIYLYVNPESANNGYIYYWNSVELSDGLLYYAEIVVNNGSIIYDNLAEDVK